MRIENTIWSVWNNTGNAMLMSNHVHLLIETGKVVLSRIMQGLQLKYTRYYNRKYNESRTLISAANEAFLPPNSKSTTKESTAEFT